MIASEIPLTPRVQVFPAAASVPMSSGCVGAMAHRRRPGPPQERGGRSGSAGRARTSPLASSPLGQGQGRAGQAVPAGGAARRSRSLQVHLHPWALARPRLSSRFPVARPALRHALVCSAGCRRPDRQIWAGPAPSLQGSERAGVPQRGVRFGRRGGWQWPQSSHIRKPRPARGPCSCPVALGTHLRELVLAEKLCFYRCLNMK